MACAGVGYWVYASGIVQAGGGGTGSSVSSASLASIVRSATLALIMITLGPNEHVLPHERTKTADP